MNFLRLVCHLEKIPFTLETFWNKNFSTMTLRNINLSLRKLRHELPNDQDAIS